MQGNWTFGKKIAAGFAVAFALLFAISWVSYNSIGSLISTSYSVTHTYKVLEEISNVLGLLKDAETGQRGYLLTRNDAYLEPFNAAIQASPHEWQVLRELTSDNPEQQHSIDQLEGLTSDKFSELRETVELRRNGKAEEALKIVRTDRGKRLMDEMRRVIAQMNKNELDLLKKRALEAEQTSARARVSILYGGLFCLAFVCFAGFSITRSLGGQIGSAVGSVQSSSAELQAAANQQASGAREQTTAMTEISTTVSELVATSKQIAEGAQRVAQIAEQTATSARTGDEKVSLGQESMTTIRKQVDMVVSHMLDLSKKAQEIGAVLDVVAELAEQTNILAINATIEAVGAGDSGKRFAVVADEIRKLADRVANATKGIRDQIDDVRGAVNTTVMATESNSKAVDNGSRQFAEIAQAFRQIAEMVKTTTGASREIELSTKQQAAAAEQVKIAINDVAQTTRETEASSNQTLQTASQLALLSSNLQRMIKPERA